MQPISIPAYELDDFGDLIKSSPDVLSLHPCVIKGFVERWPAARQWANLGYLAESFGHLPVAAGAPQFTTHKHATMCQVQTDYGTYLKYVENPDRVDALFEGKWSKGDASMLRKLNRPLYSGNLRIVRHSREKVFSELDPIVPRSIEPVNNDIPYFYQCGNHFWLYVSLAGALTPLHQDNNAVFAYLGQLKGEKRALLYSPDDKRHFYNPDLGYLDPLNPNDQEFPTWREAQPWTAVLTPGDLLIWGSNWAHHVVTLSQSITVSFDFVTFSNLEAYTRSNDWRNELGLFARKNATLIRERIQDTTVHEALESATEEDLGKAIALCVLRSALQNDLPDQSRRVKEQMLWALSHAQRACGADERTPMATLAARQS